MPLFDWHQLGERKRLWAGVVLGLAGLLLVSGLGGFRWMRSLDVAGMQTYYQRGLLPLPRPLIGVLTTQLLLQVGLCYGVLRVLPRKAIFSFLWWLRIVVLGLRGLTWLYWGLWILVLLFFQLSPNPEGLFG
jgi:hypothetical protein